MCMSDRRGRVAHNLLTFRELQLAKGNRKIKSAAKRPGLKTAAQRKAFEEKQAVGETLPLPSSERPKWATYLTDREYLFVKEYCVDLVAYKAALRAGIGTTRESASAMASELRRMPHVAQAIDAAIAGSEGGSTRARIVEELGVMAFHHPGDLLLVKNHAELEALHIKDPEALLPLRKVKTVKGKNPSFEIETVDKLGALDKLAKASGLYRDEKVNVNTAVQVVIHQRDAGLL